MLPIAKLRYRSNYYYYSNGDSEGNSDGDSEGDSNSDTEGEPDPIAIRRPIQLATQTASKRVTVN